MTLLLQQTLVDAREQQQQESLRRNAHDVIASLDTARQSKAQPALSPPEVSVHNDGSMSGSDAADDDDDEDSVTPRGDYANRLNANGGGGGADEQYDRASPTSSFGNITLPMSDMDGEELLHAPANKQAAMAHAAQQMSVSACTTFCMKIIKRCM